MRYALTVGATLLVVAVGSSVLSVGVAGQGRPAQPTAPSTYVVYLKEPLVQGGGTQINIVGGEAVVEPTGGLIIRRAPVNPNTAGGRVQTNYYAPGTWKAFYQFHP